MLRLAASLERASEHPLAEAIVAAAANAASALSPRSRDFESITGKGVDGDASTAVRVASAIAA